MVDENFNLIKSVLDEIIKKGIFNNMGARELKLRIIAGPSPGFWFGGIRKF